MLNYFLQVREALKSQRGLTLIELLAVILILGILAAITIPVVAGQGESARISAHESNVESVEAAAERYDLERTMQDEYYSLTTDSHPLVLEGYLEEVPENPWSGTNADYNDYDYIITVDARGVAHVYLANGTFSQYLKVSDEGEAVGASGLGDDGDFVLVADTSSFWGPEIGEDFLKQRYYNW